MMEIIVNRQKRQVEDFILLEDFMKRECKENFHGIAVAINKKVIPREQWNQTRLQNGQELLIIKATQGG